MPTFLNIYQNGKFYWPKMSKILFIMKFKFFMSFGCLIKSAYDTDDNNRISYNQICFSDAIFFLWRYLLSYLNKLFPFVMCTPIPHLPTWEKQIKKSKCLISFKLAINYICSRLFIQCDLLKSIPEFCEKGHDLN